MLMTNVDIFWHQTRWAYVVVIQSPGRRFEAIRKMTPIQVQLSLFIGSTARITPDIFETFLLGVTIFGYHGDVYTSLIRMSLLQSCFGSILFWVSWHIPHIQAWLKMSLLFPIWDILVPWRVLRGMIAPVIHWSALKLRDDLERAGCVVGCRDVVWHVVCLLYIF